MSVKQMGIVWDLDIPRDEKYVLLAYADHAEHDGTNVRPSLDRIAWKTGYSKNQVRRIGRKLVERELMVLVKQGRGRGNPPEYKLTLEKGITMAPFEKWREGQKGYQDDTLSEKQKGTISDQKGTVATVPEPSIEPSYSRRGTEQAQVPQKSNPIKVLVDGVEAQGVYLSDQDKKQYAGQVGQLRKKEVAEADILRAVFRVVSDWPRYPYTSLQKALSFADGHGQVAKLKKQEEVSPSSPECAINALADYERDGVTDLRRFATLARKWDFTCDEEVPWEILREISPDQTERNRLLDRIRSVVNRAVREAG